MINKVKVAAVMAMDSMTMLVVAIAVWLPCLFMYGFQTANPHYITLTLLYGTAYFLIVRMVLALVLLLKVKPDGNE